jgi:hypothetical protein
VKPIDFVKLLPYIALVNSFFTIQTFFIMKTRTIAWGRIRPSRRFANTPMWVFAVLFALFSAQSCKWGKDARLTTVYGKVIDQAGQPVDSVTILFAGHKGVSGGVPIKETLTDSIGSYSLMVNVPKEYLYASIRLSLRLETLRNKYSSQNRLIYRDGVEQNSCCNVTMGGKTNYDFVLLPK